ncbi:hypothetical protein S40288_03978 [Stachybotrys chartarum IBT 40288]|nr:hypothetical protein S40288_03978 [Stachybotrys chartarum IBT 40288]
MSVDNFKVIIAGGGIAGLTLAIMLERFDIDYVILEAYSKIAPPVGASVGLFPNGLRILDQLGCYDEIKRRYNLQQKGTTNHRNKHGRRVACLPDEAGQYEVRHGYGLLFFERTSLLEILFDRVKHKEKVLVNKKVHSVDLVSGGVHVKTADGDIYPGSILVGADGVHSAVRKVMTSLGQKLEPGYFTGREEDEVTCNYICDFGIAQNVPNWIAGETNMVQGNGRAAGVVSGPDNVVYWFMTERLPEPKRGADIPKFTAKEEVEFTRKHKDFQVTETVKFGDVIDNRKTSTLTALAEIVHKKWFFRRIIALGDSVHKPNPVGGQGANAAMESCAELINALLDAKKEVGSLNKLTNTDIEKVFRKTQDARHERAHLVVDAAHEVQALMAYENPLLSTIALQVVLPNAGNEFMLSKLGDIFAGGASLRHMPMPNRPREVPFNDELPAKPVATRTSKIVLGAFMAAMSLIALSTTATFQLPLPQFQAPIVSGFFGKDNFFTNYLNSLVSAISQPLVDTYPAARLQLLNFASQLIAPLLVYTIEGYRLGNQGTPLSIPVLFVSALHFVGFGRVAPFHGVLAALATHKMPTGRAIPQEVAQSLIPALIVGYMIPTAMAFMPTPSVAAWQNWIFLSLFAPFLFSLATFWLSSFKRWANQRPLTAEEKEASEFDRYRRLDIPALRTTYRFAFIIQAAVHILTVLYSYTHPELSVVDTFLTLRNPFGASWTTASLVLKAGSLFKYNMATGVLAMVISNLYSVWELRRHGYITTSEALLLAARVAASQVFVGPGATYVSLWEWREDKLITLGPEADKRREAAHNEHLLTKTGLATFD